MLKVFSCDWAVFPYMCKESVAGSSSTDLKKYRLSLYTLSGGSVQTEICPCHECGASSVHSAASYILHVLFHRHCHVSRERLAAVEPAESLPASHTCRAGKKTSIKSNPANGCPPLSRLHLRSPSERMVLACVLHLWQEAAVPWCSVLPPVMMYRLLWKILPQLPSKQASLRPVWSHVENFWADQTEPRSAIAWWAYTGSLQWWPSEECFSLFSVNQITMMHKFKK